MPRYRVTVRHGRDRLRYETFQLDADDLVGALRAVGDRLDPEIASRADLAEIRLDVDPDAREYAPE